MVCKVGDTVRFLNDVGGGVVIRFIGKNQVLVQDEDGFEVPVLISEVVVINDYSTEKKSVSEVVANEQREQIVKYEVIAVSKNSNESIVARDSEEFEIFVGFCPKKQGTSKSGDVDMYLINDSTYQLFYSFGLLDDRGYISPIRSGILEDDSKLYIKSFSSEEVNSIQQLCVSLVLYKNIRHKLQEPEHIQLSLNPVKLFRVNAFVENAFFDERAMLYTLLSSVKTLKDIIEPTANEIAEAMKAKKAKPIQGSELSKTPEIVEVDLHIESLVEDSKKLTNSEIVDIQLSRFTTALDIGMRSGTKRMVFIHGVGNGKLKYEIVRLLNSQYAGKLRYQDASFKEYGYGATMVIL